MPLVKLGYLLIRTIAKPVSGAIKNYAKDHKKFREMCISVAQRYHKHEVKLRRGLIPKRQNIINNNNLLVQKPESEIRPLDTNKAIDTGANFIGETIVFLIAGILLVADQLSSRAKEAARREAIELRFRQTEEANLNLQNELKKLVDGQSQKKVSKD